MNFSPELLLIVSVGVVGVLHTIVPDHWVPITLIARQRGWSKGETARAALQAGIGHVVSTLIIASVIWFAGVAVAARFGHFVDTAASVALIGFDENCAVDEQRIPAFRLDGDFAQPVARARGDFLEGVVLRRHRRPLRLARRPDLLFALERGAKHVFADVGVAALGDDLELQSVGVVEFGPGVHPPFRAEMRTARFEMAQRPVGDRGAVGVGEEPLQRRGLGCDRDGRHEQDGLDVEILAQMGRGQGVACPKHDG